MDKTKRIKDAELDTELTSTHKDRLDLTRKIAEYLYQSTLKTKIYYHRQNPKILGSVAFWLEEKNSQVILMYNVHPKDWNFNKIAFELDNEEQKLFENQFHTIAGLF
jgi:hypothetical protein